MPTPKKSKLLQTKQWWGPFRYVSPDNYIDYGHGITLGPKPLTVPDVVEWLAAYARNPDKVALPSPQALQMLGSLFDQGLTMAMSEDAAKNVQDTIVEGLGFKAIQGRTKSAVQRKLEEIRQQRRAGAVQFVLERDKTTLSEAAATAAIEFDELGDEQVLRDSYELLIDQFRVLTQDNELAPDPDAAMENYKLGLIQLHKDSFGLS